MPRRPGSNSFLRSHHMSDKRLHHHHPNLPASHNIRFWIFILVVIFFLFQHPIAFPSSFAQSYAHLNTTLPLRQPTPIQHVRNIPQTSRPATRTNITDTSTNPPANIAYFIQISEDTIRHLPRLLRALHHPSNVYAIHFDLKIPDHLVESTIGGIRRIPKYSPNVHIMPSELITYRGISMLLNTINAMRLLLDLHSSWHYFINLSGADYPLLSPQTTRKLLSRSFGLNFFTFAPKRTWPMMAENRLSQLWYDESLTFRKNASIGRLTKLAVRNPLVDSRQFEVTHAEAWMVNSRQFCDFIIRGDMARKMLVAFAYAVDSSEHYFATLAWNHAVFKQSIVPHSLRMIVWLHEGVLSGQHPYFIDDTDGAGNYKFRKQVSDSVLFFARKFQNADSNIMDFIDQRVDEQDVVNAAETHINNKIKSRAVRITEL